MTQHCEDNCLCELRHALNYTLVLSTSSFNCGIFQLTHLAGIASITSMVFRESAIYISFCQSGNDFGDGNFKDCVRCNNIQFAVHSHSGTLRTSMGLIVGAGHTSLSLVSVSVCACAYACGCGCG